MVTKAPELNVTGFNLGEKKAIKESYAKVYDKAAGIFANYGITLTVDAPAFEVNTKDKDERKYIGNVGLERYIPEITEQLEKWLKRSPDYIQALKDNVNEIVYSAYCYDKDKEKVQYELSEKRLSLRVNCAYICYDLCWENIGKFLEQNLQQSSGSDNSGLVLDGFNLGEQKDIKDSYTTVYGDAAKFLSTYGVTLTIDMPSFEFHTRGKDERQWVGKVGLVRYIPEITKSLEKWTKASSDYAEALTDSVSEIIYSAGCYDKSKDKVEYELKDKKLTFKVNCAYICYDLCWEKIGEFLEKSL